MDWNVPWIHIVVGVKQGREPSVFKKLFPSWADDMWDMELDVHLIRVGDEPWGFRLIGGVDFAMPLTVVKVIPNSPAEKAGLQNGDTVSIINDTVATNMTHEDSREAVAVATEDLSLGITRGLYDPVLDDTEPIFEPIDQEDFDQPSRPTEVFEPKDFTDLPQLLCELPEFQETLEPRSLTESPFVLPTKPYRPFSTEPLVEIPPLEEPIILNPEYHDVFAKLGIDEDSLPKSRFKLPISEQYNPDGKKQKVDGVTTEINKDIEINTEIKLETSTEMKDTLMTREEVNFMKKMRQDIDLNKIELTASSVVEESIEKAVTVAEVIKKEIDVELHETSAISDIKTESTLLKESTERTESNKKEALVVESKVASSDVSELVNLIDKTTEEIIKHSGSQDEIHVAKKVEKFETIDNQKESIQERQMFTKQELEETIEAGSVKRKSVVFEKEAENKTLECKDAQKRKSVEESKIRDVKAVNQKDVQEKVTRAQASEKNLSSIKSDEVKTAKDTKMSTSRLLAEQRAYTIGLQTIPNIRGTIHSSHHYDLLLKTFFIHLTDVMVALSRFILAEPVLSKEASSTQSQVADRTAAAESVSVTESQKHDEVKTSSHVVRKQQQNVAQTVVDRRQETTVIETADNKRSEEHISNGYIQANIEDNFTVEEDEFDKPKLSGSKMAQLTEKRSEELIQTMGAVISEFQNKAGIEESTEVRDRRSRSRSKIEEEVMQESDPLEWLSKVDKTSQEIIEVKNEVSSSISESMQVKKTETRHESTEMKTSQSKEGKNMYIAIVEAHVYTNKDAILDEQITELSETASVQSADETNLALEANEASASENVALEDVQMKEEVAKAVIEAACEITAAKNEVQIVEQTAQETQKVESTEIQQTTREFKSILKKRQVIVQVPEPVAQIEEVKSIINETQAIMIREEAVDATVNEVVEKTVENEVIKVIAERPKTLDLKLDEDPHIVKKKLDVVVSEPKTEEDRHIVKKTIEVKEQESSVEAVKESTIDVVNEVSTKSEVDDYAALKVIKEQITDVSQSVNVIEAAEISIKKEIEVAATETKSFQSFESKIEDNVTENSIESHKVEQESTFVASSIGSSIQISHDICQEIKDSISEQNFDTQVEQESTFTASIVSSSQEFHNHEIEIEQNIKSQKLEQESTFVAKSIETSHRKSNELSLNTEIAQERILQKQLSNQSDENNNIDTPTPSTVPPTPLTDEYIFKLQIPLPKGITPVPPDLSPEADEDPHIVKKKLIPHIDTTIEEGIVYDPPLPTPPGSKVTSPVYTKPGLRGGADRREIKKEEILEIERKSSLLASAIDETIKSIEEYKEEVGIKKTTESQNNSVIYNGFSEVVDTKVFNNNQETQDTKMDQELSQRESNKVIELPKTVVENGITDKVDSIMESIPKPEESVTNTEGIETKDPIEGYRPVQFDPEEIRNVLYNLRSAQLNSYIQESPMNQKIKQMYKTESGEVLGTIQGIVDGLEEAVVDIEIAKEMGKPGLTEDKIAELISGESEMLREAHVMGLTRVITSHMHRENDDDSSVDFKKIKPIIDSLRESEVLKALNDEVIEELMKEKEKREKEEKKWTTFLQKPKRPVPRVKFGYPGYVDLPEEVKEAYKVKIVKQPKPKVAPDYKSEDFNTGLLPWEERALKEPTPPPVEAEDPILIPEEAPEILEAVDPLPESEVPDLEDSGIPLPPPKPKEEEAEEIEEQIEPEEDILEAVVEEAEPIEEKIEEEMDQNKMAEQLINSVQNMIDPNASLEQQLAQMRAQLAALAQLPCVIQQSLELVTRQLSQLSQMESSQTVARTEAVTEMNQETEVSVTEIHNEAEETATNEEVQPTTIEEVTAVQETEEVKEVKPTVTAEEIERMRMEEEEMLEEQRRIEKQKKELMEQMRLEQEARQLKQRPTPRVGKPKPVFGPMTPQERPLVLPGGRKWRKPKDAYNDQFIAETLAAQAEIIQGKAKGY